jgi:hypothetical protein
MVSGQAENFGSPYSRFGLGDRQPFSLAQHRAMGGITTTFYDSASLNLANPASLAQLKLTNVEFGAIGNISRLATDKADLYRSNFNFGYLMLGFPVKKWWGTAIGFQPYAFTNYNISSEVDSGFLSWRETYNGRGGINQLSWSNGFKLAKGLYFGVTANFLFGTVDQQRAFFYPNPDSLFLFNVRVTDRMRVNDVLFSLGLQYQLTVKKAKGQRAAHELGFGLTADVPGNLNASSSFVAERFTQTLGRTFIRDTVANISGIEGVIRMPVSVAFGMQYNAAHKFLAAAEMRYTQWSEFSQFDRPDSLRNSLLFAGGFQYTPKYNAIGEGAFFKTLRYRAGLRYYTGNVVLRETAIDELGMTFGIGIPMRRQLAMPYINLAVETGQRGTIQKGLVRERYTRFTLGFTLNDRWFIRRKYD